MKLTGAMTAIATPMFEDGTVDYISLNNLIDFQIENSISAIVAVGTTGESATIDFEEHVLNEDYSIKTLVAISGSTQVPQVFRNGERIGGFDQLEKVL